MDGAPLARTIVQAVLADLRDRAGFDHWWDEIDEDIQAEIVADLGEQVQQVLDGAPSAGTSGEGNG